MKIKKENQTVCIYHSRDLDGWMSAAIVSKWWEENPIKKEDSSVFFIGWDYGDDIPDLSDYGKVIMCDISFSEKDMEKIATASHLIWIDHHKSAIDNIIEYMININYRLDGLTDSNFAACELTWKYFFPNEEMPEIVRLLGRYDCFGHKGTDEEQKVLEFQYGARQCMSNPEDCYNHLISDSNEIILQNGFAIYSYLKTEAEQIYKKAFPIKLYDIGLKTNFNGTNPIDVEIEYDFLCVNQERFNPINFGIDYHKDGYDGFACFWYKEGIWSFSLYNDNGQVNCSSIAKLLDGGGHQGAAGFICDNNKMLKIINK